MTLLFCLHDFTRTIWHSTLARDTWAPRMQRVTNAWMQVERQSVVEHVRDACLTSCDPQALPAFVAMAARADLLVLPLERNGIASQYSSTSQPAIAGQPWHYRVALVRAKSAREWIEAWTGGERGGLDNRAIGTLLGYPPCCREFFQRVWIDGQGVDTTWEMAEQTEHRTRTWERGEERAIAAGTPPEANILLRWFGLRLVPHLPCSFTCEPTVVQGKAYAAVMRSMGFSQELEWLCEMLEWPIEWSALHGIAEVRTPVATISTRTTATAQKRAVQRNGTSYPREGAQGLRFPFRVVKDKVTGKPSFQRSQTPLWELNGFGSEQAMRDAHDVLLRVLPNIGTMSRPSILDLGCGTGAFLEKCAERGWAVNGVEVSLVRAGAAKIAVRRSSLFDVHAWDGQYGVIAFMPGRLLEGATQATQDEAERVRAALRERAAYVLLYAYGDWLTRYEELSVLMSEAGMGDGDVVVSAKGNGVAAALVHFGGTVVDAT